MSGESLLLLEIMPVRIYPIIPALAYMEEKIVTSFYDLGNEIDKFFDYLVDNIPDDAQKLEYYKKRFRIMWIKSFGNLYGDVFINRNTKDYFNNFVLNDITSVYTPEFDKEWGYLSEGSLRSRKEYENKKTKYIYEESEKYLKYAKKYIRERYKEQKKK